MDRARIVVAAVAGMAVIGAMLVTNTAANAVPPFPIADSGSGVSGQVNSKWTRSTTVPDIGGRYTSDGWTRLTDAGSNQVTNLLSGTAFPSSTGFETEFDYRMAGGATSTGKTGDGMSVYLVNGARSVTRGGSGSGLAYANTGEGDVCGVSGGFVGVGLDAYGGFSSQSTANVGGLSASSPSSVGVRGSGEPCVKSYPWVGGQTVAGLVTTTSGDPATSATSTFRRVRVTVQPQGATLQLTVSMTAAVAKNQSPGAFSQVVAANLASVSGQAALPSTLKLGFGASTGNASNYMDVRNINVRAFTDAALTQTVSASTPGRSGYPARTFLPGDPVSFVLKATNNGPSTIGNAPNGVAVVYDNLSDLPLTNVSWTCAAAGGGSCVTGGGTGAVVTENWAGPPGSSVTVTVSGTVPTTVSSGTFTSNAAIPTNFTTMTVNLNQPTVQRDGGASDSNLSNNSAPLSFQVALVADPDTSAIVATPPVTVANGVSTSTVTVTLLDVHGNRLSTGGATVTMNTSDGTLSNVTDNGDGTYTATLTAPDLVGRATIGFTVDGTTSPHTTDVVFVPGPAVASTSLISASPSEILADGVATSTITVELRDADGNHVRDGGDAVTLSTSAGTLSAVVDNGNGTYSAILTSGSVIETATIGFTVGGVDADAEATVLFVEGDASPVTSTITAAPTTIPASGTDTSIITITLRDAAGHQLTTGGEAVAAEATSGRLSSLTDNGDGTYTAILTASVAVETATIGFSIDNELADAVATVDFVAGPFDLGSSTIDATPPETVADGVSTVSIAVTLRDSYGHQLNPTGQIVTMQTTNGSLSPVTDNTDGTFSALLTAPDSVGSAIVGFAVDGVPAPATVTVTFVAGPPSTTSSLIGVDPAVIPANGTSTSTVVVTLRDAAGNQLLAGGNVVTMSTTSGTLSAVRDNQDGTYTAVLTSATAATTAALVFTVDSEPAQATTAVEFTPVAGESLADTGLDIQASLLVLVALIGAGLALQAGERRRAKRR